MTPGNAVLIYTDDFLHYDWSPQHPLRPERLRRTVDCLRAYDLVSDANLRAPQPATDEDLRLCHSDEYIAVVKALGGGQPVPGMERFGFTPAGVVGDNPVFPRMYEAMALIAGGSLLAADLALADPCCIPFNIGGGLHHAHRDRASGFCVFDDPALAIAHIRRRHPDWRIAYIDIDAHHGDGVQEMFYDSAQVLTVSLHQSGRTLYPGTGEVRDCGEGAGVGYAVNVPLWPGTDDETYHFAFDAVVPPILGAFRPDLVVAQLGCDTHFDDPLTMLHLTVQGYAAAVARIVALAPRLVALGGGGYAATTVPRAWTLAFAALAGRMLDDELPPAAAEMLGMTTLRDAAAPPLPAEQRAHARVWAEEVVIAIREHIFPVHGL